MNNNCSDINDFPSSAYLPVCSVCVANYNGEDVISACIDSIKNQQFAYPVEIIVHDDASTDNSVRIIHEKHPEVILFESPENAGFCISNNRMAAKARGKYILFLNNDACLLPDALGKLYSYSESRKEAMITGLPQYDMETGKLIDRGSLFDLFLNPVPNTNISVADVGMVMGACLWLPKSLWEELGGFPEWFETLAEDMYLCCLAKLTGYPVRVLPDSGFKHWVGKSLGGGKVDSGKLVTSIKRRALSERNKSFVMALIYPLPLFQVIFPLHLLLLLIEGLTLSVVKFDFRLLRRIYLPSIGAVFSGYTRLARLRKTIQARRRISLRSFLSVFHPVPYKVRMFLKHGLPEVK
ncbi:MAG: glycosyltransferase [Proteobacteria bacterium]|nr:glycosyltransferase [Pseudomonadota bacterium]MBU1713129.1 glycosyltransferase [Pseudomonadota bacterium]